MDWTHSQALYFFHSPCWPLGRPRMVMSCILYIFFLRDKCKNLLSQDFSNKHYETSKSTMPLNQTFPYQLIVQTIFCSQTMFPIEEMLTITILYQITQVLYSNIWRKQGHLYYLEQFKEWISIPWSSLLCIHSEHD